VDPTVPKLEAWSSEHGSLSRTSFTGSGSSQTSRHRPQLWTRPHTLEGSLGEKQRDPDTDHGPLHLLAVIKRYSGRDEHIQPRHMPYDRSGHHTYAVVVIRLRLLRGTFLERYRSVDTASLPSEGDGWVLDA